MDRPIYKAKYLSLDSNDVFECTDTELLSDWLDAVKMKIGNVQEHIERLKDQDEYVVNQEAWVGYQKLLAGQLERRIAELQESRVSYWKDICRELVSENMFAEMEWREHT